MLDWLKRLLEGKAKRKDNTRKYSAYMRRIREMIDDTTEKLLWIAENRPDLLLDLEYELSDQSVPLHRRARAFVKALTLFENEPTVLMLIAEIYTQHSIEVSRKD